MAKEADEVNNTSMNAPGGRGEKNGLRAQNGGFRVGIWWGGVGGGGGCIAAEAAST